MFGRAPDVKPIISRSVGRMAWAHNSWGSVSSDKRMMQADSLVTALETALLPAGIG
jgi:hypothetical protein